MQVLFSINRHLGPEEFSHLFSGAQLINQANILDPLSGQEGFRMRTPQSSSLSSLGEIAALEKRNSKLQAGICRLPSQVFLIIGIVTKLALATQG